MNIEDLDVKTNRISRVFIKDEVYEIISDRIITGELPPESKININSLAKILNTSRTPVREAILRLENEGLVLSKANRWTIVAPINLDELSYTYSVVASLEALALEQAFPKIDKDFIMHLEVLNQKLHEALSYDDRMKLIEIDNDFHNSIIDLSGNYEIPPIIDSLKKKLRRAELSYFKDVNRKTSTYLEHENLIESLKDNDLDKAITSLKSNWYNSIGLLKKSNNL